jgi:hypothetical protein
VRPPGSGSVVPGACAASTESVSQVTYTPSVPSHTRSSASFSTGSTPRSLISRIGYMLIPRSLISSSHSRGLRLPRTPTIATFSGRTFGSSDARATPEQFVSFSPSTL